MLLGQVQRLAFIGSRSLLAGNAVELKEQSRCDRRVELLKVRLLVGAHEAPRQHHRLFGHNGLDTGLFALEVTSHGRVSALVLPLRARWLVLIGQVRHHGYIGSRIVPLFARLLKHLVRVTALARLST